LAGFLRQDLPLNCCPESWHQQRSLGEALQRGFVPIQEYQSPMMVWRQHRPDGTTAPLTTGCVITTGGTLVDLSVGNQERSTISLLVGVIPATAIFIVISGTSMAASVGQPERERKMRFTPRKTVTRSA